MTSRGNTSVYLYPFVTDFPRAELFDTQGPCAPDQSKYFPCTYSKHKPDLVEFLSSDKHETIDKQIINLPSLSNQGYNFFFKTNLSKLTFFPSLVSFFSPSASWSVSQSGFWIPDQHTFLSLSLSSWSPRHFSQYICSLSIFLMTTYKHNSFQRQTQKQRSNICDVDSLYDKHDIWKLLENWTFF